MDPIDFARLPRVEGQPTIKLMDDPGGDGGDVFLSVVTKGANGRAVTVRKVDPGEDAGAAGELGEGLLGAMRTVAARLGFGVVAMKSDGPETFEAAIAIPNFWDRVWEAHDGLCMVLRTLMESETVEDREAAMVAAIESHAAHLSEIVKGMHVRKLADVAEVVDLHAELAGLVELPAEARELATKAASDADLAPLIAALRAGSNDGSRSVTRKTGGDTVRPSPLTEDDVNKIDQLKSTAIAASETAIKIARDAGITDNAELVKIGQAAAADVWKAAVGGPPQPSLTPGFLAEQLSMAPAGAKPNDPLSSFSKVLAALGMGHDQAAAMVKKIEDAGDLGGRVDALELEVRGSESEAPIRELATKALEAAVTSAETVRKIARLPTPSRATGEQPSGDQGELARKAADSRIWSGSAFDFGTPPAPATTES